MTEVIDFLLMYGFGLVCFTLGYIWAKRGQWF